ncbi:unnamed protein product [Closterium sp. NIES-54]
MCAWDGVALHEAMVSQVVLMAPPHPFCPPPMFLPINIAHSRPVRVLLLTLPLCSGRTYPSAALPNLPFCCCRTCLVLLPNLPCAAVEPALLLLLNLPFCPPNLTCAAAEPVLCCCRTCPSAAAEPTLLLLPNLPLCCGRTCPCAAAEPALVLLPNLPLCCCQQNKSNASTLLPLLVPALVLPLCCSCAALGPVLFPSQRCCASNSVASPAVLLSYFPHKASCHTTLLSTFVMAQLFLPLR